MRVLLDTHTFLWLVLDAPELSVRARSIFTDRENVILLSTASLWEMAIKVSLGKLKVMRPLAEWVAQEVAENGITILPPCLEHVLKVEHLPFHHRDPFDRLLIAQAQVESVPVLGCDLAFDAYDIERVW